MSNLISLPAETQTKTNAQFATYKAEHVIKGKYEWGCVQATCIKLLPDRFAYPSGRVIRVGLETRDNG